jgi:hypothetical protein
MHCTMPEQDLGDMTRLPAVPRSRLLMKVS